MQNIKICFVLLFLVSIILTLVFYSDINIRDLYKTTVERTTHVCTHLDLC